MNKYIAEYEDKNGNPIKFSLTDDSVFAADERAQKLGLMNNWTYISITTAEEVTHESSNLYK